MTNLSDVLKSTWRLLADDQRNYNRDELTEYHSELINMFPVEQRSVYDQSVGSMESKSGFIVLNRAIRGFASLLLSSSHTIHSMLNNPLEINKESICGVNKRDNKVKLFRQTKLIIWEEAPMMNIYFFEAFDRSMRDIMLFDGVDNKHKPFGGIQVVLCGDFRQTLSVVRRGSRSNILVTSINDSILWKYF
ncbi:uncharacterized protein [Cicer arietinum]|uniref:uncharacterized protein n=1 Tax=Cicer arietinum TaxID=3827 RepID=UPI00032A9362